MSYNQDYIFSGKTFDEKICKSGYSVPIALVFLKQNPMHIKVITL